jgi:gas vesicle protein
MGGAKTLRGIGLVAAVGAAAALGACGTSGEQDRKAYEACLAAAKGAGSRIAAASFATFEDSKIAGSTGEEEIRVNIPYELAGQKALYQCIAQKQPDGTFKVVF